MKYINLPKPHGFLIWKGTQRAIASDKPLLSDEKMFVLSDDELYGEVVLSQPIATTISGLEGSQESHCIRPEDRRLYWPDAKAFYIHKIKEWIPFEEQVESEKGHIDPKTGDRVFTKRVLPHIHFAIKGDEVEILDTVEPTVNQKELLNRAERLPKQIMIMENAVYLDGNEAIFGPGCDVAEKHLNAVLDGAKSDDSTLPLYHLALVRTPRLALKKKELELMEGEKCGPDTYVPYGVYTFADLKASQEANETAQEIAGLSQQFTGLVSNIMSSPDIADKPTALASLTTELATMMRQEATEQPEYMAKGLASADDVIKDFSIIQAMAEVPPTGVKVETGEKVGKKLRGSMMDKIKTAYETLKEFMSWAEPADDDDELDMSKGIAIKQVNGKPWFIAYSTNAFEDREREIFSTKALEKYVEEAEKKDDRGYFNFWHIKTKANPALTDFAKKEWQGVEGRFLIEAGPFLDDEKGQAALKFFKQYPDGHPDIAPEGWGCSPEYRYLPEERKSGTYDNIWITRTSALPRLAAANIWTKGTTMAISEQQKQAANTIFGEKLAAQIFKSAEDATKELEEAGVAHKSMDNPETTEETKPVGITVDDLQPFVEAMNLLATNQAELKELISAQGDEIKQLKITEAVKQQTQIPRAQLFTLQRATESQKTIVPADDPLIPVQTEPLKDKSGAAFFFQQPKQ